MDERDIAGQRLLRHGISGQPFTTATGAVGWLGALQSQEYAVAKWSVGQRAPGVTDGDLDRALADGTLVRTHVLRPTWHFVARDDARWLLALTAPRVHAMNAHYYRRLGLDEEAFAASNAVLTRVLAGGNHLTRREVAAALADGGIAATGLALGYLLMYAELEAVVCSGALKGRQRTYALFDEQVPPASPWPRQEALAELTRRYFASHGPATVEDYQWWSGLTAADARRGVELAGPALERLTVGGVAYWDPAQPPPGSPDPSPTAHLLQAYDEYVVAYRGGRRAVDLAGLLDDPDRPAPYLHVVILDGQVVGSWQRKLTARAVTVEVQLRRRTSRAELAALEAAVDRYGAFLGVPATLAIRDGGS